MDAKLCMVDLSSKVAAMIGKEGCLIPNFWIESKVDSMAAWKAGASGENIPSMVEKKMLQ